jgi:hypothetical protein
VEAEEMTHIDPTTVKIPPRRRQIDYEAIAAKMQAETECIISAYPDRVVWGDERRSDDLAEFFAKDGMCRINVKARYGLSDAGANRMRNLSKIFRTEAAAQMEEIRQTNEREEPQPVRPAEDVDAVRAELDSIRHIRTKMDTMDNALAVPPQVQDADEILVAEIARLQAHALKLRTGLASASVALLSLFAMFAMAMMRILWGGN